MLKEDLAAEWIAAHEDGEMQVYRRDFEEDGINCDRCKTVAVFPHLTAQEICEYFYNPNEKLTWECKFGF